MNKRWTEKFLRRPLQLGGISSFFQGIIVSEEDFVKKMIIQYSKKHPGKKNILCTINVQLIILLIQKFCHEIPNSSIFLRKN